MDQLKQVGKLGDAAFFMLGGLSTFAAGFALALCEGCAHGSNRECNHDCEHQQGTADPECYWLNHLLSGCRTLPPVSPRTTITTGIAASAAMIPDGAMKSRDRSHSSRK